MVGLFEDHSAVDDDLLMSAHISCDVSYPMVVLLVDHSAEDDGFVVDCQRLGCIPATLLVRVPLLTVLT